MRTAERIIKSGSPFTLWSTFSNFYFTASGPLSGVVWSGGNVANSGNPIWVASETSAAGFVAGQPETYTIDLTSQDWLGDQQPMIAIAATTIINPFGETGNLGGPMVFGSIGASNIASGGVYWWQASQTPGDYAVEFQPFDTTHAVGPSTSPNTTLTGSAVSLATAIADPTGYIVNYDAANFVLSYATRVTSTTKNIYFQAFNTAGVATSPLVDVAPSTPNATVWNVAAASAGFYYSYSEVNGASTGVYREAFNPTTGAVGAPSELISQPAYSAYFRFINDPLPSGNDLVFTEGIDNGQHVLQANVLNSSGASQGVGTTIALAGASASNWSIANVYNFGDGLYDNVALIYVDSGQVHLDLLDADGQQIGADFIVPGATTFGRIVNMGSRVEISYPVSDPNGGTDTLGYIYDTATAPYVETLGASNEYIGTPFNDTFTDAAGTFAINGGGGTDTFIVNNYANQVVFASDAADDMIITTPGGATTLERFTAIELDSANVTVSGSTSAPVWTLSYGNLFQAAGPLPANLSFAFNAGGGRLVLQTGAALGATISNFVVGDSIDFAGVAFAAGDTTTFAGNGLGTGGTVTIDNAAGAAIASFSYTGALTASEFSLSDDGSGKLLVSASVAAAASDFTGNGKSDVLLANANGALGQWDLSGASVTGGGVFAQLAAGASIVGTGDFNGDGEADLLAQNGASLTEYLLNGTAVAGGGYIDATSSDLSAGWSVAGTGDFNGDGKADLLLANGTTLAEWLMNGTQVIGGGDLNGAGAILAPDWTVAGIGDFNGDGKADLLLQEANGNGNTTIAQWQMNGAAITGGAVLGTLPTGWSVAGIGDFNGDGAADVLLQHTANGVVDTLAEWQMNGSQVIGGGDVDGVSNNLGGGWSVAGIGDFNGDGKSDILLANVNGAVADWLMNGANVAGGGMIGTVNAPWSVV